MEIIEKVIEKDHKKEYASKGVAGTALGLGIAGTALWLFNGGLGNGSLFGRGTTPASTMNRAEIDALAAKESQDALDLTRFIYEQRIDINNNRFADREQLNSEIFKVYSTQLTADFDLYKSQRDGFDVLAKRISDLETKEAVTAAVEPWRAKVLEMQINGVAGGASAAVALEAERRACADGKIVNYVNSTFYPQYIAGIETSNTSTEAPIYNPLCNSMCTPCSPYSM